jgi:hypothetical protein
MSGRMAIPKAVNIVRTAGNHFGTFIAPVSSVEKLSIPATDIGIMSLLLLFLGKTYHLLPSCK